VSQPAVAAEPVAAADAEVGLSLEGLAAQSGVVGRTIRFYQSERLLPKPRRDAREPVADTAPSTWSASD
jgi:hypothetical protein